MRIKVTLVAKGSFPAKGLELEFPRPTLADLRTYLTNRYRCLFDTDRILIGSVNDKVIHNDREDLFLQEGDSVMFVVPMGGA